jgi:hypothetical protein
LSLLIAETSRRKNPYQIILSKYDLKACGTDTRKLTPEETADRAPRLRSSRSIGG